MEQNQHRYFKTEVQTYDPKSGMHPVEKCIYYPGASTVNGIGQFIDKAAYDEYIRGTYESQLQRLNKDKNDPNVSDELIMFEVGKTALMMLLAQQGCEGIRLTQIARAGDDGQKRKSFILQGILNAHDPNTPVVAKAVRALEGDGDIMTEEIHGLNLKEVFRILQGNGVSDKNISAEDLISLLW